jgi:deoxyribonuclease-4
LRFGIHVPRRGSLAATAKYAAEIGCQSIQIFSGNPMSWTTGRFDRRDADQFAAITGDAGIDPVVLHAPYLVNLASPDVTLSRRSLDALVAAMARAHELRTGPVIVHSGNHMGAGADRGIEQAVRTIQQALAAAPAGTRVALENGAGKGTEIGVTVEELWRLTAPFPESRVGIALDTAHLWGMGHDLRRPGAVERLVDELRSGPGLARLWAIHGNDSSAELGSRRDRHALWSEGVMGRKGLRSVVGCAAFADLPFIFEIPGHTPEFDRKRLASMKRLDRRLARARRP